MGNDAGDIDKKAADTNEDHATQSLGRYNDAMDDFTSNVNSTLAAGNPYKSKDYLESQNLETSGAMHSVNDATDQALQSTVARTGTNSAALANTEGAAKRAGARDLTEYEAGRDTQNEDKWLQEENQLRGEQLAGANSEAGVFGTSTSGQAENLKSMTQAKDAESQMWAELGGKAIGAAGTVGAAFA